MNNKILKLSATVLVGAALMIPTSCTDLLDLHTIDGVDAGSFWKTSDDFTGNVVNLQSWFRSDYAANILFWASELRGGQFTTNLINTSGAVNVDIVENNYDVAHTQFSNFMGTPGFIADINELIYRCENNSEGIITEAQRDGLLGIAYGWRAYFYFQVYKMYGGAVIRTEPDVLFGERDPQVLRKARSTAEETLAQIKSDIQQSLNYFNSCGSDYPMNSIKGQPKDYYWSKAATEMLAGEVYLWSGKVATGNHAAGGAADVAQAKQYFSNVINNYGFKLYNNWFGIWTTPHNSESIYAVCYTSTQDKVYGGFIQQQVTWSKAAGASTVAWSVQGPTGFDKTKYDSTTGTFASASRFQYYSTDPTKQGTIYSNWGVWEPQPNRYMWKNAMYYQFDQEDVRSNMWFPQWYIRPEQLNGDEATGEKPIFAVLDFDPKEYDLLGTFILKFTPGYPESSSTGLANNNDQFIYRLTLAYTYMAEIANYEGNFGEIAQWINPLRERVYGANWDESKYGFKPSTFAENEAQILMEKNKEFIMEGQRWWDLRRMTTVKDGSQTDHMVFQPQGCIGYGLNIIDNPWMLETGAQGQQELVATMEPVLSTSEAHKLLWPINQSLLNADPLIEQNPGY